MSAVAEAERFAGLARRLLLSCALVCARGTPMVEAEALNEGGAPPAAAQPAG
jgi:hypothetical protein